MRASTFSFVDPHTLTLIWEERVVRPENEIQNETFPGK